MNRDDLDAFLADVLAEHLAAIRADLFDHIERLMALKPLPPFVPPPAWTEGKRHSAGTSVRHRGGIFYAQRDTEGEPASDEAWVPLIVGLAGLDLRWSESDRAFVCRATLSDGALVEHHAEIAVPIVRGYWNAETTYMPGDRVFRYGEHHCLKMCMAIDPTAADAAEHWEKVGGKYAKALALAIDAEGTISENGRPLGSIKPLVAQLFADLTKRAA